ncbi:MAG: hypothetical protein QOD00_1700 [Blastocatellia bacterium]|jgi:hypothetical protein|nr:hypothetical protein [Blastocatellia bacterium]
MGASIGKGALIKLDDTTGTPVDLSSHLVDIKPTRQADSLETTVVGGVDPSKTHIPGLLDGESALSVLANATTRALINALFSARYTGTLEIGPDGSTSGLTKETVECFITKFDEGLTAGGLKKLDITLKYTGGYTVGAYA